MSLKSQLLLWSSSLGDVLFGSAQAGAIGTSFGNGAATAPGGSSLQMGSSGNFNVQIASAGISPAATAADKILALLSIPASALDAANRGIQIMASGSLANNTNTKTLKLITNPTNPVVGQTVSGGTTVASFTTAATAAAGGWNLAANIYKYGAGGSNTQIAIHEAAQSGNVVGALVAPSLLTMPENATITVAVTGNAATTAGDVVFNFLEAFAMN